MKKYDYIFSIGQSCSCAQCLKENNLRRYSGPFDWVWGAALCNRINFILDDFKDFIRKDLLKPEDNPAQTNFVYRNTLTDIRFNHDFPRGADFENIYPEFEEKYTRRINRFLKILKSNKDVLLVYLQCPTIKNGVVSTNKDSQFEEISKIISDKYPNVDVLYICHNDELKDLEVNVKQINEHLYYAECFNYDKNDILPSNNTNYKNAAKVLSQFKIKHDFLNKLTRKLLNIRFMFYKNKTAYRRILWFRVYKK